MSDELAQSLMLDARPDDALDRATLYLEGAGTVASPLRGRLERMGDRLVVHHGRIRTQILAAATPEGTQVDITRLGKVPLQETRGWLVGGGLGAALLAWAIAVFRRNDPLPGLVTLTLFFLGVMAFVVVLYVVDRSLERRSQGLILGLEEAMRGDPLLVLQREVDALTRSSSVANAFLFYFAAIAAEFVVFAVLWSDGVRAAIDQAVTLDVMRWGFLLPVAPAVLFGSGYFLVRRRQQEQRMALVERRAAV